MAGAGVSCTSDTIAHHRTRDLSARSAFRSSRARAAGVTEKQTSRVRSVRQTHDGMLAPPLAQAGGAARATTASRTRFPVKAVDTTGAGDISTPLIYSLLKEIRRASAAATRFAAAVSCTRGRAMASVPSLEDVRADDP
jgi:sugar/nucleoside kinase (ribokinase family)